jgi:PPE-repeat protein
MTAPIWMASPPEVHSGLLSSGPGPGSLLAAAGVWNSLSTEYASVAEELSAMLAAVQDGVWQGPGAESYVAANVPYLAWLMQASANSAAAAAQHETAAAAYTAALAAMPTLAELGANHAVHAVLVATNFFGINTIPIALNEADYVRMWIQAATTMTTYHTVSSAAVASTPQTDSAPQIQKADSNPTNNGAGNQSSGGNQDSGPGPTHLSWYITRGKEIMTAFEGDLSKASTPSAVIYNLLHDPVLAEIPHWAGEIALTFGPQLTQLTALSLGLIAPALATAPPAAPVGAVGGFAGLAGLAGLAQPVPPVATALPVTPAPNIAPGAGPALPTTVASGSAPASAPVSAPSAVSMGSPAPPSLPPPQSPPPPITGAEGFGYAYLVGGVRVESESRPVARAAAEKKAPKPDAIAAAATAAPEQTRRHRGQRVGLTDRGYRYEYLDSASEVAASNEGAGAMGFAGTADKAGAERAAGLTTLADDSFGEGPTMPMMPSSWEPASDEPDTEGGDDPRPDPVTRG